MATCAGIALVLLLRLTDRPSHDLSIATGPAGGTYLPLGQQFAAILQSEDADTIGEVEVRATGGSVTNIHFLAAGKANLALAMEPALYAGSIQDGREDIRVLARLYMDRVHILVRTNHPPARLADLLNDSRDGPKRVFLGPLGSGTRHVAQSILERLEVPPEAYVAPPCADFNEAINRLTNGVVDIAFIVAGTRSARVTEAMATGTCRLLDLGEEMPALESIKGIMANVEIPNGSYDHQRRTVQTVGADALLLCTTDLPAKVGRDILRLLTDNAGELLLPHTSPDDIQNLARLADDPEQMPHDIEPHPGYEAFRQWSNDEAVWILTGTLNGRYYRLGKTLQGLLRPYGIECLVVPTQGSLENVNKLADRHPRPTLAIMQYDVALAAQPGVDPASIYGKLTEHVNLAQLELQRIAVLHQEKVHVLTRHQRAAALGPLMQQGGTVCLGPEYSGASLLARAVLDHHQRLLQGTHGWKTEHLPVTKMVECLYDGGEGAEGRGDESAVDIAFFVSDVPSTLLQVVLNDPETRLLSMDSGAIARLVKGPAFEPASIEPDEYHCLSHASNAVQTVATDAVLVAGPGMGADIVHDITKAVFSGEAYLGIPEGRARMAKDLPSLPLHPAAKAYYQKAGLRPSERTVADHLFEWLSTTWRTLTILVILVGALAALLRLKRDKASNGLGRRILNVSVESSERASVQKLMEIRRSLPGLVQRRWWSPWEELDKPRWRYLDTLIDDRIRVAQENLTRRMAREAGMLAQDHEPDASERAARLQSLKRRVRSDYEKGELNATQLSLLLHLLKEARNAAA